MMKIAAVLFILSVCYIASTEQAAIPAGVHAYPSRPWKDMERKAQQGMEEFKAKAKEVDQQGSLYEINIEPIRACANQQCVSGGLYTVLECVELRNDCRELLKILGAEMATYQAW